MSSAHATKVSIVGTGKVGMSTAFSLLLQKTTNQILLVGRNDQKLIGEQLDLQHALNFIGTTSIDITTDYSKLKNSDVVIFAAGAAQKPGDTRLDLTQKNLALVDEIIPKIVRHAPDAIILMVTNPVDILTYRAYVTANLPKGRVFGSSTVLDTSRFRFHLSEMLQVNPKSIHAYILGEHGDSSFPVLSSATVGGQAIHTFPHFSEARALEAYQKTRDAAYQIIKSKGATYYAIAAAVTAVVEKILRDSRSILPVSIPLHGQYGHTGMAISVPCIVGRNGVDQIIETKMNWDEKAQLKRSLDILKKQYH